MVVVLVVVVVVDVAVVLVGKAAIHSSYSLKYLSSNGSGDDSVDEGLFVASRLLIGPSSLEYKYFNGSDNVYKKLYGLVFLYITAARRVVPVR